MEMLTALLKKMPRMWDWWLTSVVLVALIYWIAPQQLPVMAYKMVLVSIAAVLAYWIDRSLFKRAAAVDSAADGWVMLRRALVFLGCVLGLSLGI